MLGNSRHRVSLETVATVLTFTRPCLQRSIDDEHVRAMVQDQMEEFERHGCFSLLQSITVASLANKVFVLDGQHRIKAFDWLREQGAPVENVIVPVVQYTVRDMQELADYYTRINQHKPVHPLELKDSWQCFERPFVDWVARTYTAYMKKGTGGGTRCPHIGLEQLKTELNNRSSELVSTCNGDPEVLCQAVREFNRVMHSLITANGHDLYAVPSDTRRRIQDCLDKEKKKKGSNDGDHESHGDHEMQVSCEQEHDEGNKKGKGKGRGRRGQKQQPSQKEEFQICFLGAFRRFEWLDVCTFCIKKRDRNGSCGSVSVETCWALLVGGDGSVSGSNGSTNNKRSSPRLPIPYEIRQTVWSKTNSPTANLGACYTCGHEMWFKDMECGHVVAHALGGTTDVGNLMAVCRTCNRDMGIQNMESYRRRICEMRGDAYIPPPSASNVIHGQEAHDAQEDEAYQSLDEDEDVKMTNG